MSQTSAIVRDVIAKVQVKHIIRSRNDIREEIRKQLHKQLKSLGVWLETVEIVDVLIKNEQLFKDMQSKYRENIKRSADLNKITTEENLTQLRNQNKKVIAEITNKKKLEIEEFR